MNSLMTENGDLIHGTQGMRNDLLASLSDEDLSFQIPGNPTLGELFRDMGNVQQSYVDSFKNFAQDFDYRHADNEVVTNVSALKTWFQQLDSDLDSALEGMSEEDIKDKTIERPGFAPTASVQIQVYIQAILIFYGKVTIYFRALGKALPEQWEAWIG